jgi:hypothetical protein
MDPKELERRRRAADEATDSLKHAVPRITLLNEPLRHHDGDGALTADSTGELGEDGHVEAQPDPLDTSARSGDSAR